MNSSPADGVQPHSGGAASTAQPPASPQTTQAFREALARAQVRRLPHSKSTASAAAGQSDSAAAGEASPAGQASPDAGPSGAAADPVSPNGGGDAATGAGAGPGSIAVAGPASSEARHAELHDGGSGVPGDAGPLAAAPTDAAASGGAQGRAFAALPEQPQASLHLPSSGVTVQFPDNAWAVSGLDVNVLPDGAVDMVLSVGQGAHDLVSEELDRLKRRLEAKGVSVAGIQLDSSPAPSLEQGAEQ